MSPGNNNKKRGSQNTALLTRMLWIMGVASPHPLLSPSSSSEGAKPTVEKGSLRKWRLLPSGGWKFRYYPGVSRRVGVMGWACGGCSGQFPGAGAAAWHLDAHRILSISKKWTGIRQIGLSSKCFIITCCSRCCFPHPYHSQVQQPNFHLPGNDLLCLRVFSCWRSLLGHRHTP